MTAPPIEDLLRELTPRVAVVGGVSRGRQLAHQVLGTGVDAVLVVFGGDHVSGVGVEMPYRRQAQPDHRRRLGGEVPVAGPPDRGFGVSEDFRGGGRNAMSVGMPSSGPAARLAATFGGGALWRWLF